MRGAQCFPGEVAGDTGSGTIANARTAVVLVAQRRRERRRILTFQILALVAEAWTNREATRLPAVLDEEVRVVLLRRSGSDQQSARGAVERDAAARYGSGADRP